MKFDLGDASINEDIAVFSTETKPIDDNLSQSINEFQRSAAFAQQRLDDLTARVDALDGKRPKSTSSEEASVGLSAAQAAAVYAAVATFDHTQRERFAGSLAASAEQVVELLAGPDGPEEYLAEALGRFVNLHRANLVELIEAGPSARLDGTINLVRGFYAESLTLSKVLDKELPVPPGVDRDSVQLAAETNTAGYDLTYELGGQTIEAQVKVGASAARIREHFDTYPDIDIVYSSSDAAADIEGMVLNGAMVNVVRSGDSWPDTAGPVVVDIGETSREMSNDVVDALLFDLSDIDLVDELPLVGLGLHAMFALRGYASTDREVGDLLREMTSNMTATITNAGVGTAASAVTGVDFVKPLTTVVLATSRSVSRGVKVETKKLSHDVEAAFRVLSDRRASLSPDRTLEQTASEI